MENLSESKGLGQLQKFTDSEMHVKFWVAQISFQVALRNSWKMARFGHPHGSQQKSVEFCTIAVGPCFFMKVSRGAKVWSRWKCRESERVKQNNFLILNISYMCCVSVHLSHLFELKFSYQMHEVEMCKTKSSPKSQGCRKFLCHTNLWECNFWGVGRFGLRRLTYVRDFRKILVMDMAHQSSIWVQWSSLFKGSLRSAVLPIEIPMTIEYSNPEFLQQFFCLEKTRVLHNQIEEPLRCCSVTSLRTRLMLLDCSPGLYGLDMSSLVGFALRLGCCNASALLLWYRSGVYRWPASLFSVACGSSSINVYFDSKC